MGIFDFVRDVGEKLGIRAKDQSPSADTLKQEVEKHGLQANDLKVAIEGDTVKVTGKAPSTEMREKIILALGNVQGIGKVDEAIEVSKAEASAVFYTVKKGDTLWKIAEAHYGKGQGTRHQAIFEANRPMLKHPDKIYPGQVLRIPTA
jgi:nucleoid-associated protein YgaU